MLASADRTLALPQCVCQLVGRRGIDVTLVLENESGWSACARVQGRGPWQ